MILATDFDGVFDVVKEVLRGRLALAAQERHEVDTDDSAFIGERFELRVSLIARQRRKRCAAGVADGKRCARCRDGFACRAFASVRKINQEPAFVQAFNQSATESTQAGVARLKTAV